MWIAIWVINDYDPATRYKKKHILPALVIPGPNKPKNFDSFLFRSLHHLSALQQENDGRGIYVWDGFLKEIVLSRVMFMFGTADALGLPEIDSRVGHHGALGCRMSCGMKGRHKYWEYQTPIRPLGLAPPMIRVHYGLHRDDTRPPVTRENVFRFGLYDARTSRASFFFIALSVLICNSQLHW